MPKSVTIVITLLVSILILLGLSRQILDALNSGKRIEVALDKVNKLQQENNQLKKKLSEVQSTDFLEQTARDKLGFSKKGETVIIIPDELMNKVLGENKRVEEEKISNWQGWLRLFLR
ncbi:septum formation initiator family protein [Candidatus Daviesbacteria bacterium]|nr:septum formation initiator family protein [Candidatus Daviesbacteria bacterium]